MCTYVTYSKSELFPNAFSIDSVNTVADTALYVGDTINLQIKFRSFVEAAGYYELTTKGGFRIIENNEMERTVRDSLTYDTNQITINYQIIVDSIALSEFTFRSVITDELHGINNNQKFEIQAEPIGNRIDFPVYQVDGCIINEYINPNDQTDDLCQTFTFTQPTNPSIGTKRQIHINGSVTYNDIYNSQGASKSPYTDVWLFFRKIGGQTGILIHPSPFVENKPVEGEHYAKCDDDGDFSLDFEYDLDSLKNSEENATFEVILMVSKENEALWLESPSNHNKVNGLTNLYRTFQSPETMHVRFFKNDFGVRSNYDPNSSANQDGNHQFTMTYKLKEDDGSIFRHITLSREFLKEFYDEETFEDLGMNQIHTIETTNCLSSYESSAGAFNNGLFLFTYPYLWINGYANSNSIVCSHEYGHYFNNVISRFEYGETCDEGFAIFYSWIYRQWLKNQNGDGIEDFIDNCEIGPYSAFQNSEKINGQWIEDIYDKSNRFGNISKTRTDINMSKFACFLSNLYDGTDNDDFTYYQYQGKDNEDLNGFKSELFNYFYTRRNSTPTDDYSQIHQDIKSNFGNNLLNESIDALYNFMDFNYDRTLSVLYGLNINMKSPNLEFEMQSVSGNEVEIGWPSGPKSYQFTGFPYGKDVIWQNRKTSYLTSNFNNWETGVRHYRKIFGQEWENPIIVSGYPSVFSCFLGIGIDVEYRVATYNNLAGDSYIPYYFHFPFKRSINDDSNFTDINFNSGNIEIRNIKPTRISIISCDILGINQSEAIELDLREGSYSIPLRLLIPDYANYYLVNITLFPSDKIKISRNFKIINW